MVGEMAQKFTRAADMIRQMKEDLVGKTFPHLLMSLSTATKTQLQAGLFGAANRNKGRAPPLVLTISKIPAPGTAEVSTKFLASLRPGVDERSPQEAAAYKDVFERFYKDRLGSKALVLRLLATVGVT